MGTCIRQRERFCEAGICTASFLLLSFISWNMYSNRTSKFLVFYAFSLFYSPVLILLFLSCVLLPLCSILVFLSCSFPLFTSLISAHFFQVFPFTCSFQRSPCFPLICLHPSTTLHLSPSRSSPSRPSPRSLLFSLSLCSALVNVTVGVG